MPFKKYNAMHPSRNVISADFCIKKCHQSGLTKISTA
jgi:hypothetical protein